MAEVAVAAKTPNQNRAIWGMAGRIGLEVEELRDLVERETGQRRISTLSKSQAGAVIDALMGLSGDPRSPRRDANRASTRQVYMIRNIARGMGWGEGRLTGFLEKRWGASRPEWLRPDQAWKVIEALKAMVKREAERGAVASQK